MKKFLIAALLICSVIFSSFSLISCSENNFTDNSTNKVVDNKGNTSSKTTKKSLSKEELTKLIIKRQIYEDFIITPVKIINAGKDFSYEKTSESNLFFCSEKPFDPKNLDGGLIVNFNGEAKDGSYSFKIVSYDLVKSGGTGTVDIGHAYPNGKITLGC